MSFSKFKLDKKTSRSNPLPIASASPTSVALQRKPASCTARRATVPRKSTSCLACRASKTRCDTQASKPGGPCSRCQRLSKRCVFDARLAEITAATAFAVPSSLNYCPSHASSPYDEAIVHRRSQLCTGTQQTTAQSTLANARRTQADAAATFLGVANQSILRPLLSTEDKQLQRQIDSLITFEATRKVFYHFTDNLAPKCPVVLFPAGITVQILLETKPVLLLAILSVASAGFCPLDQQNALLLASKRVLADRALVRGEKSLELVQALQISILWFRAPESFKQINFNQLAHVMITMAIDLELDADLPDSVATETTWERAERQRSLLGCFIISQSISIVLRQSKMLSWSSNMENALKSLEEAKISPCDVFFCELVRSELVCYTIDQRIRLSKRQRPAWMAQNATAVDATELAPLRTTHTESCSFNELERALIKFGHHVAILYAREPAMHVNHNIDEFAAPFALKSLKSCTFMHDRTSATELALLREVMAASHGVLDSFLELSLIDMLALPPHIYGGRVIYSIIVLCKLYKTVKLSAIDASVLPMFKEIRLENYLERLGSVAKDLLVRDERNCLSRSLLIVEELRKWKIEESKTTLLLTNTRSISRFSDGDCGQRAPPSVPPNNDDSLVACGQNTVMAEESASQLLWYDGEDPLLGSTEFDCGWFVDDTANAFDFNMLL